MRSSDNCILQASSVKFSEALAQLKSRPCLESSSYWASALLDQTPLFYDHLRVAFALQHFAPLRLGSNKEEQCKECRENPETACHSTYTRCQICCKDRKTETTSVANKFHITARSNLSGGTLEFSFKLTEPVRDLSPDKFNTHRARLHARLLLHAHVHGISPWSEYHVAQP